MNKISRIIFTTDVLREPHLQVKSGDINKNCAWFNMLFGSLVKEISDLPLEYYDFSYMEDFTKKLYKVFGFTEPFKEMDWLYLYNEKKIKTEAIELFKTYFNNSLVIGFELPLIFRRYFDELGIVYIDVIHHPIRYLDDLMHAFSTNDKGVYYKLMKYQENPDLFKLKAIYEKVRTVMRSPTQNILPNSCVIFGQTRIDRSILKKDNTLASLLDYKDEINQLSKDYAHIYFKPHPANKNNDIVLDYFKKNIENFSLLENTYTYDLYANPNVALYASLSSGTLYEAKYFGNKIKYFYKQPFLYGEDFINKSEEDFDFKEVFVSVNKFYLQFDFWSDVLSPLIKTKSKSPVQHLSLDNTLRYALGVSWGYNDCHYLSIEQKVPLAILLKKQNKGYLSIWKFYKKVFGNKKVFPFYYIYNHIDRKLKRKGII